MFAIMDSNQSYVLACHGNLKKISVCLSFKIFGICFLREKKIYKSINSVCLEV